MTATATTLTLCVLLCATFADCSRRSRLGAGAALKRQACETATPSVTAADADKAVLLHNQFRAKEPGSGIFAMEWSDDLARRAQAWSNYLASINGFEHGYLTSCTGEVISQNLWTASTTVQSSARPWTDAVAAWYNEKPDYTFSTRTCAPGKQCGHYTLVVWDSVRFVGCGVASYTSGKWYKQVVTCDYSPAGNYIGKYPYKPGTQGTTCESTSLKPSSTGIGWKVRSDGLCDFCSASSEGTAGCNCYKCVNGTLNASTCGCKCNGGFSGSQCETNCMDRKSSTTCNNWLPYCSQASYKAFMQESCPCFCKSKGFSQFKCCA